MGPRVSGAACKAEIIHSSLDSSTEPWEAVLFAEVRPQGVKVLRHQWQGQDMTSWATHPKELGEGGPAWASEHQLCPLIPCLKPPTTGSPPGLYLWCLGSCESFCSTGYFLLWVSHTWQGPTLFLAYKSPLLCLPSNHSPEPSWVGLPWGWSSP